MSKLNMTLVSLIIFFVGVLFCLIAFAQGFNLITLIFGLGGLFTGIIMYFRSRNRQRGGMKAAHGSSPVDSKPAFYRKALDYSQKTFIIVSEIKNETIREKMNKILEGLEAIFENFDKDPEDIRKSHQFLIYYPKTLWTIADKYKDMPPVSSQNEQMKDLTQRIINTLEEFDKTCKKHMEKLMENDLMNIEVELDVLDKTMKAQNLGL